MYFPKITSFKRRLIVTGAILFAILILAAIAVMLATQQYSFYLERSSYAQHVYTSYRTVSDHTYRKLSAMAEIVADGNISDLEARYRNQQALRDAIKKVRFSIDAELLHVGDIAEAAELDHFNQIEALAEKIIQGSEVVRISVTEDDRETAKIALDQLRSPEIEGKFNNLIDEALAEELREVRETERVAKELYSFLRNLLPFFVLFFLIFGAILINAIWQALTRSLHALEEATDSYRKGNFGHRIQNVKEAEFSDLADALNHMATELASQLEKERVSQENLESLVSVRTRELEKSNAQLETISETRKQFLADISHELRTPLTIIQGESDFALRGAEKSAEQYIDALGRVREQAIHTTRLVQDLLFVARTEDGKAPIHKRLVSVAPLVKDVCDNFRPLAAEKRIDIKEHYSEDNLEASVDAGRIRQVIAILLDNAIRYSEQNSKIDIIVKESEEQLVLQVCDTGIGMSYYESSQVFSRFYRGSEGVDAPSGTGLGLPVAKAIVDAHGGTIFLQSDQGTGTNATVMLPIQNNESLFQ